MAEWVSNLYPIYPGINVAGTEVERKFEDSYSRIDSAKAALDEQADGLDAYLEKLHIELGEDYADNFNVDVPAPYEISGTFPEFDYGSWALAESPTTPVLEDVEDVGDVTLRDYPLNVVGNPDFDIVVKPTASSIPDPDNAPEISVIDLPVTPEFIFPDDPTITTIDIDDAPTVEVPAFLAERPTDDLSNMTIPDFDYREEVYSSEVWAPLAAKLRDGILNGGTGLAEDVEAKIWDNAVSRQEVEEERQRDALRAKYANKGFDVPQGAQMSAEAQLEGDIGRNRTELNNKIAIDQANLAQSNTHFLIEKGINFEQITIGFFDAQQARALEARKIGADIIVQAGRLMIDRFNGRAQVYNAMATAYEAELKAAMADLEVYRVTMDGKKVASDVQKNVVDIYTAQVGALESRAKLYTAQVEGAKAAAEIERLKMENYKITIEAYQARWKAEELKYQAYGTEVDAEKVKVEAYAEKIKAHLAEIESVKAANEGKIAEWNARIARNAEKLDRYKAELLGYDSRINEISKQQDIAIRRYEAETNRDTARARVVESQNNINMKAVETNIEGQKLTLDSEIAKIRAIKDGYTALLDLEGKTKLGIYNAMAQLMSSAMASVSASASASDGLSRSYGHSTSIGNSLGEQHSYNQSV